MKAIQFHNLLASRNKWLAGFAILFSFIACSPTRRLSENEKLLWKNEVEINQQKKYFSKNDILAYVRPETNQKLLGVLRLKLGLYNIGNNGKDSRLRKWLMRIGEPPVMLDTARANRSKEQIKFYLNKQGFFNATVSDSIYFHKRNPKKAYVKFEVQTNKPYYIRNVKYDIYQDIIKANLEGELNKSLVKKGDRYNYNTLDNERARLTNILQNKCFFAFTQELWYVEVDSALDSYQVDVTIRLKKLQNTQLNAATFKKHKIADVTIHCGYNPYTQNQIIDTTLSFRGYEIKYYNGAFVKPEILFLSVFIKSGDFFKKEYLELSYKRLNSLNYFGAINIQFDQQDLADEYPKLATNIYLSPKIKQNVKIESRVTNSGGNLGVSGSLVYGNKNAFKGAELFEISLTGGFESQQIITDDEDDQQSTNRFLSNLELNTIEFGPETRLSIPKFLLPFNPPKFSKTSSPTTVFSTSLNFQERPDYIRSITNFSLSYEWKESDTKKHIITPAEISVIKINPTQEFTDRLIALNDQLLINSYRDHLISALRYSFIYNTQAKTKQRHHTYFRANIESAGNLLNYTNGLGLAEQNENFQELFNIRFAHYLKSDLDLRKYFNFLDKSTFAVRTIVGAGKPLENLNVLPFERSFFGGGANDIRAWQARTIGPGSYTDTSSVISFDKIGDLKITTSAEYRFDVFKYLEGALFVDAGNVWLLNKDNRRIGGLFKPSTFVSEIAVGAGIGARLDFDFFIIRLDAATRLKDPALKQGERWFYQPKTTFEAEQNTSYRQRVIWNLGIGYPF